VPGSLKKTLDWVVFSGELVGLPIAVISASPHPDGGAYNARTAEVEACDVVGADAGGGGMMLGAEGVCA
jgi:chromate reductase, NAD(P)H dehydrogenase (quinone)